MPDSYLEAHRIIESAFRFARQDLVDILLEVRRIAFGVKPWATERIRRTGITIFDAKKGGTVTGGICFVDILNDAVRIRFGRGVFLYDPGALLSGNQKYMRHLDIDSFDAAPWDDIEQLIRASAELDESVVRRSDLWPAHQPDVRLRDAQ